MTRPAIAWPMGWLGAMCPEAPLAQCTTRPFGRGR